MQNVKLIASDMDPTLLTSAGTLPPHFDRYLHRLGEDGIEFAVASGRPLYTLQETFPHFSDRISMVCDNGGLVYSHGQLIGKSLIPEENKSSPYQLPATALTNPAPFSIGDKTAKELVNIGHQ